MIVLSVQRSEFLFFLPNLIFHILSFFILQIIAWIYPSWSRASWAKHQTEFGDNRGGKLIIKGPKMLRQLQAVDKIISVLLPIAKIYEF